MKVLGIDCGKTGAVALLDTETNNTTIEDTVVDDDGSLDCDWFFGRLLEWEPEEAVIEAVYRPNSLVEMKGEFGACCKLFGVPLLSVAVVTWKRRLLGENTSDKQVSIECASKLFPSAALNRPSPKGRKVSPNADRAESLLLAAYLHRLRS